MTLLESISVFGSEQSLLYPSWAQIPEHVDDSASMLRVSGPLRESATVSMLFIYRILQTLLPAKRPPV
jgi:hypothetical protein